MHMGWSPSAKRCLALLIQEGYVVRDAIETAQLGGAHQLEVTLILSDDTGNTKDEGK